MIYKKKKKEKKKEGIDEFDDLFYILTGNTLL